MYAGSINHTSYYFGSVQPDSNLPATTHSTFTVVKCGWFLKCEHCIHLLHIWNITNNKQNCRWSFLDGMQRVLLFTECRELTQCATNVFEIIQQEITLSLHGFGLSLINNLNRQEILYIGIASSGVLWETCKLNRRRYKPLGKLDISNLAIHFFNFLSQFRSKGINTYRKCLSALSSTPCNFRRIHQRSYAHR